MEKHQKFNYDTIQELIKESDLPVSDNLSILKHQVKIGDKILPNTLGIHPMEGCDGQSDGSPGELTFRRYDRFAAGGAGLLWFEATAVTGEGRANPRQLFLNDHTYNSFKKLYTNMMDMAPHKPYTVIQLTHSGRYSRPFDGATSIVAVEENPHLDPYFNPKREVITDYQLTVLEDEFVKTAKLAESIGFDAVDIKACHRYLISELLSARTREGKYGGNFENRTRFLLNIIDKIKESSDIDIAVRLNAYDTIPSPYGWGCDSEGNPDLTEPEELMRILKDKGVKLINISAGNPYYNPHIGRPCDIGPYVANEHPIQSVERLFNAIHKMKQAAPGVTVMGTGFSWFREYGANIAAGAVEQGYMDVVGFGRQVFAYPDFAYDIIENGCMKKNKCCIACSKCSELMRFKDVTGCVIRDSGVYFPIWKQATDGQTIMSDRIGTHI